MPLETKPTGKVKETLDWLKVAFASGRTQVAFPEIHEAVGTLARNFIQRVVKADSWNAGIRALEAEVAIKGVRGEKFIRVRL